MFEAAGETASAARATAGLADVDVQDGRLEEAMVRLETARAGIEADGPSIELAWILAQLGRMQALRGDYASALITLDRALALAESLDAEEVFIEAITSKAIGLVFGGRFREAGLLLEGAVERAVAVDLRRAWLRANLNLCVLFQDMDQHSQVVELAPEMETVARQLGDRAQLTASRLGTITPLVLLGRWAEALARAEEVDAVDMTGYARAEVVVTTSILCEQGDLARAERMLAAAESARDAEQPELKANYLAADARLLRARNRPAEALAEAERGLELNRELSFMSTPMKLNLVEALEAALELGDLGKADELLASVESLQPGAVTPSLRAQRARFPARVDAAHGREDGVDGNFRSAAAIFREFSSAFYLAVTQLEHAEWLAGTGRHDEAEPLVAEARETFEVLGARPWLERAALVTPGHAREALTEAS
jgi:tetratricopeptide (TPR) repeat protein